MRGIGGAAHLTVGARLGVNQPWTAISWSSTPASRIAMASETWTMGSVPSKTEPGSACSVGVAVAAGSLMDAPVGAGEDPRQAERSREEHRRTHEDDDDRRGSERPGLADTWHAEPRWRRAGDPDEDVLLETGWRGTVELLAERRIESRVVPAGLCHLASSSVASALSSARRAVWSRDFTVPAGIPRMSASSATPWPSR